MITTKIDKFDDFIRRIIRIEKIYIKKRVKKMYSNVMV